MIVTIIFIIGWICLFAFHAKYIFDKIKDDNDDFDRFLNKSDDLYKRHTQEVCKCVKEALLNLVQEKN